MKNTVTQSYIDALYREADKITTVVFNKCLILSIQLINGFIITESSACVDKDNFSEEIGMQICEEKIKNKLWELEGYRLQCELSERNFSTCLKGGLQSAT